MLDIDWFLSLLDKSDMAYLCKKFKLTVTGFQRNMNLAPQKTLGNALKTALTNGFQKKKTYRKDHLPFEVMIEETAKELLEKYPVLSELSFYSFAEQAEWEMDIKAYEMISFTYQHFQKEYEEHYESIVSNAKEKRYLFYGLNEELKKSPFEKIGKVVGVDQQHERNIERLKAFEKECLSSQDGAYEKMKESLADEESVLYLLTKAKKKLHVFILTAFLLKEERYLQEHYQELVRTTVFTIQTHEEKQIREKMKKKEKQLETLQDDIDKDSMERDRLLSTLETLQKKEKDRSDKTVELLEKVASLEHMLRKNEPLNMVYYRIIAENRFVVVTKDVSHFTGTPFEGVVVSPSQFKKDVKAKNDHSYKEMTIFVTRSSFTDGGEWYYFQQFLEKYQLGYEELGQYEIACYIQEIIQFLSRKEVLVYADEI